MGYGFLVLVFLGCQTLGFGLLVIGYGLLGYWVIDLLGLGSWSFGFFGNCAFGFWVLEFWVIGILGN